MATCAKKQGGCHFRGATCHFSNWHPFSVRCVWFVWVGRLNAQSATFSVPIPKTSFLNLVFFIFKKSFPPFFSATLSFFYYFYYNFLKKTKKPEGNTSKNTKKRGATKGATKVAKVPKSGLRVPKS